MTKYLKLSGFEVDVFTQKIPSKYRIKEKEDVVNVHRIFSLDPFHLPLPLEGGRGKRDFVSFPDNKIGFIPFLINNLKKEDIYITSAPPVSIHLSGLYLKKKGYKWIAEFRDPYIDGPIGKYLFRFENELGRKLERIIVENADAVVLLSPGLEKEFKKRYGNRRILTITNGYDEKDFGDLPEKEDKFTLTYLGTLNKTHRPDMIIEALKILNEKYKNLREIFSFKVIGYVIDEYLKNLSVLPFFHYEGYLSRKEAIKIMLKSHLLLLILTDEESRFAIPGKTFNYLRSGIPILLVSGEGSLKEFLGDYAIYANTPLKIAEKIEMMMNNKIKIKKFPNVEEYEWENIGEKYRRLIMECVKS
uniref:Glycosyltransferase subfamily 4-like N-terminal domain-containing protein n=1 Tax=candidate division WOR-3 bacterium TaxID=2052148 RepID=A0A7C4U8D8_UNCW3